MSNIGPYLVGAAFWIFIGAVAVAGMVTDYKRRRGSDWISTRHWRCCRRTRGCASCSRIVRA